MDSPMPEKQTEPWASWEPCEREGKQGAAVLERLATDLPGFFAGSTLVSSRWSRLPFYQAHRLMELQFVRDHGTERAFVLDGPQGTVWLNGDSNPIHDTNEAESLALTESTVADYARFFFYFLRTDLGAFVLIESSEEVGSAGDVDDRVEDQDEVLTLEAARGKARPLLMEGPDATGRWLADATIAYDGALFSSSIAVEPNGVVEMTDDEPIGFLSGLVIPQAPSLELERGAWRSAMDNAIDKQLAEARRLLDQGRVDEALALALPDTVSEPWRQAKYRDVLGDLLREFGREGGGGCPVPGRGEAEPHAFGASLLSPRRTAGPGSRR